MAKGQFTILRENEMKYQAQEKGGTPIKARETTYNYIVQQAEAAFRSNPRQLDLLVEIHKIVKEELGTDIPAEIRTVLAKLKKAGQGK